MAILQIFTAIEMFFGDLIAILAAIGSLFMFFSIFGEDNPSQQVKKWSYGGLLVGALGQFSMYVTGTAAEKIGFVFQFTPELVNSLLLLSVGLLVLRWWIISNRYRFI
jgi:hypothetical protein